MKTLLTLLLWALLFVLWLFAAPIGLMWLFSQVRPVYLDRGLIASALMLYIAFAVAPKTKDLA